MGWYKHKVFYKCHACGLEVPEEKTTFQREGFILKMEVRCAEHPDYEMRRYEIDSEGYPRKANL